MICCTDDEIQLALLSYHKHAQATREREGVRLDRKIKWLGPDTNRIRFGFRDRVESNGPRRRTLAKGARDGQDDEPARSVPLHRIEKVPDALGKDRRRLPSLRAEGAKHRVLSGDRAVHGSRVKDIASHDSQARVRDAHLYRVSREGGDFVAFKDGSLH